MITKNKKLVVLIIMCVSFIFVVGLYFGENRTIPITKYKNIHNTIYIVPDETHAYLKALRLCENQGRYKKILGGNDQYSGAYQIGNDARTQVGYEILNSKSGIELFLNDSLLQEEVMLRLLQSQIRMMMPYLKKYNNTSIGNFWITNSGILAMTHLLGPNTTIAFLTKGISAVDGNNTPISRYLQFNNFNIPIDSVLLPHYINQHLIKYLRK